MQRVSMAHSHGALTQTYTYKTKTKMHLEKCFRILLDVLLQFYTEESPKLPSQETITWNI